jgi:hypothetical protein
MLGYTAYRYSRNTPRYLTGEPAGEGTPLLTEDGEDAHRLWGQNAPYYTTS